MSFARFFQGNRILTNEIWLALGRLCFLGICADRRTRIQELSTYVSTNTRFPVKLMTEFDDPHRELKRSFSYVLHRVSESSFFPFSFFLFPSSRRANPYIIHASDQRM